MVWGQECIVRHVLVSASVTLLVVVASFISVVADHVWDDNEVFGMFVDRGELRKILRMKRPAETIRRMGAEWSEDIDEKRELRR